jgi:hypothetical protein
LKRNLPASVSKEPLSQIESKSGLELKICMNTYKIFFVEGTEDYFHRRKPLFDVVKKQAYKHADLKSKKSRFTHFRNWLEGPLGWKKDLTPNAIETAQSFFEQQFISGGLIHQPEKSVIGESWRQFKLK